MNRPLVACFFVGLWTAFCGATESRSDMPSLTLDEAIGRALAANPRILAVGAEARARSRNASAEQYRQLGELGLTAGTRISGDKTLIRPITPQILSAGVPNMPFDDRSAFWTLAYQVPLYSGGTLAGARRAARFSAAAGGLRARRTALIVRHNVVETYVGILSTGARISAWGEELKALDSLVEHIRLGHEIGRFARVDWLKVRAQRQQVVARVQALEMERQTRYAALLALLGDETDPVPAYTLIPPLCLALADSLAWTDAATMIDSVDADRAHGDSRNALDAAPALFTRLPSLDALVDSALARRSDLRALQDVAAAQRARAAAVHGSRRPQLRVAGRLTGTYGGTIDYDDTFWSVDATMSLPLLDLGRRKNLSRKADLDARAAELQVRDLEGRIRAEAAAALARVTARRGDVDTQWAAMELAAEISRLERLKYDAGRGDIDNLLRARSSWRVADAEWIRACHDLFIALDTLQLTSEGEGR